MKIARQFIAGLTWKPFPAMNCGAIFRSPYGTDYTF